MVNGLPPAWCMRDDVRQSRDFRPPRDRAAQPDDERHFSVLEMAAGLSTLAKLDAIWYSRARARASTFKVDILRWTRG